MGSGVEVAVEIRILGDSQRWLVRSTKEFDGMENIYLFLVPTACGTEHPRLLCSTLEMFPQLNTTEEKTVGILRENTAAASGDPQLRVKALLTPLT